MFFDSTIVNAEELQARVFDIVEIYYGVAVVKPGAEAY
jgi:hypothetical protein